MEPSKPKSKKADSQKEPFFIIIDGGTCLPPGAVLADPEPEDMEIHFADSYVQAGFPSPAESYGGRGLNLNSYVVDSPGNTFFVPASGDSMDLAGISDGDLLVVDKSRDPVHGDIVIMRINGDYTVKRFYKKNGVLKLVPESSTPYYSDIIPAEGDEWVFVGRVTFVIKQV